MVEQRKDHGMQPVRPIAAHELVLEQIQTAINLGRFAPGDRLPTERDLAEMLHVSRTTVREAIAVLESRGTIEVRRGRNGGAVVLEPSHTRAQLKKLLHANRAELDDVFDFRVAVESAAARLAAHRRTQDDVAALSRLVTLLDGVLGEQSGATGSARFAQFHNLDCQFHLAVGRAAGSPRLTAAIVDSRNAMFLPVGALFPDIEPTANEFHVRVVDAVTARDGDGAAQLMADHVNETRALVATWL